MKAMEPAAPPMISVPEGVLKEFISNSPSPPTAALVGNETGTGVESPKVSSTRTPSPDLPNSRNDSALPTDTPNHIVNGVEKENISTVENGTTVNNGIADTTDPIPQKDPQLNTERLNGTVAPSLKRPNEDGSSQDLKKVRVFPEEKNKSIESSVQEFNKHLDQESKKFEEKPVEVEEEEEIMCLNDDETKNLKSEPAKFDNVPFENKSELKSKIEFEVKKSEVDSKVAGRIRKLPRKELEKMILRLFSEKCLHDSQLGKLKNKCEKLETTLEANRKKTAQFHKEIEDLKKVTNRLSAEQAARKGQFVAPIRIKRSVGIQAAPHIINKSLQHAQSTNAIKTISPRAGPGGPGKTTAGQLIQGRLPNNPNSTTFQAKMSPNQSPIKAASGVVGGMILSASQPGARPQAVGGHTSVSMGTVAQTVSSVGTVRPAGQMLMMTQPSPGIMQTLPRPSVAGQPALPAPGTLVKVPVTGSTQLVAIPQTGVVLLPSNASAAAALVVSQVSAVQSVNTVGNPVVAQARSGPLTSPRVTGTSFRPVSATTTTTTSSPAGSLMTRHPAPLPKTHVQQIAGVTKKLPPQPTLKLSHKENSIVLSWTMNKSEEHETISSYQLYAYQEGNSPPNSTLWKKVGSVKALELPMACTLTQFMPGHVYHFAVRAVDNRSRLGPFSDPKSIRLEKK